jgi:VanZ family protein
MVRKDLGHCILRAFPLVVVMGIIFYFSHQPGDTLTLPDVPAIDKFAHAGEYGVLAAAALYAALPLISTTSIRLGLGVTFFCLLHALADEFHQSFIPGRWVSGWDVLADAGGALLVVALWCRMACAEKTPGKKGSRRHRRDDSRLNNLF